MSASVSRRKQRSKWWWVAAAVLFALVWRWCRSSDERIETTLHVKLAPGAAEPWAAPLDDAEVLATGPLFDRSEAALTADRATASAQSGRPMPDLRGWRSVRLRGERPAIDRTLARLRDQPAVLTAFEAPVAELPFVPMKGSTFASGSCPVRTPPYHERQGFLGPAPGGIDARAAWAKPGGRGEAVWFADIEGAWNTDHEDLPGDRIHAIGRLRRSPGLRQRAAQVHEPVRRHLQRLADSGRRCGARREHREDREGLPAVAPRPAHAADRDRVPPDRRPTRPRRPAHRPPPRSRRRPRARARLSGPLRAVIHNP